MRRLNIQMEPTRGASGPSLRPVAEVTGRRLDRIWAPDVMFIGGDGRIWNKAERLQDLRTGNRRLGTSTLLDIRLRVYQDTAIVAFTDWLEGVRDGRPFRTRSYLTRVFMKRDGRWQLVHQQSAVLEREAP